MLRCVARSRRVAAALGGQQPVLFHRSAAVPFRPLSAAARPKLKYVTSDEIEAHLLEGLTAADDESRPVNLVQDRASAERVLATLKALGPNHFHACDTEVAQIDIKAVGPVGNGKVRLKCVGRFG